jgi:catechol 2,3-dioxygenase-like lactoylglutathione lyase family enzyme
MPSISSLQPRGLNHHAYATIDMEKTHQFWTEVMGCKFLGAWDFMDSHHGKPIPDNYMHSLYGMSDGSALAFFELQNGFQKTDDGIPKYTKHLALSVDSMEQLKEWQEHFKAHGLPVLGEIDHEEIWYSVYVTDPAGLTIELTYQARPFDDNDITEGHEVLKRWRARKNALAAKA